MEVQAGYDAVASAFLERFRDELGKNPIDMKMPNRLAKRPGPTDS